MEDINKENEKEPIADEKKSACIGKLTFSEKYIAPIEKYFGHEDDELALHMAIPQEIVFNGRTIRRDPEVNIKKYVQKEDVQKLLDNNHIKYNPIQLKFLYIAASVLHKEKHIYAHSNERTENLTYGAWNEVDKLDTIEKDLLRLYIMVNTNPDLPVIISKEGVNFRSKGESGESYAKKGVQIGESNWFRNLINNKCDMVFNGEIKSVEDAKAILNPKSDNRKEEYKAVDPIIRGLSDFMVHLKMVESPACKDVISFARDYLHLLGYITDEELNLDSGALTRKAIKERINSQKDKDKRYKTPELQSESLAERSGYRGASYDKKIEMISRA